MLVPAVVCVASGPVTGDRDVPYCVRRRPPARYGWRGEGRLEATHLRALVESRHRDARGIEHRNDLNAAVPAHSIGHVRVLVAIYPDLFASATPRVCARSGSSEANSFQGLGD